jgi:heme/copper-type cytochrome/quinol oxidase subunit 2
MYFIFYFLIVILILLFILIQFFNILSHSSDQEYKKYFNLLLFVIVLSTIIGIIINVYSIIKNHNKDEEQSIELHANRSHAQYIIDLLIDGSQNIDF